MTIVRSALGFALALAAVAPVKAADIAVKAPVYKAPALVQSWGGFYIGAGIGFRASDTAVNVNSATDTTAPAVLQNMFVAANCLAGLPCVTSHPFNGTAFRVSPYLGYNWQIGRTVLGLEGDVGFADQTTTVFGGAYPATPFGGGGSNTNSFSVRTTWDASIRARAGYLVDPALLLYGTAGPSWIHVETTSNCSTSLAADGACAAGGFPALAPATISHGHTRLGYTVGGGLEAMLWLELDCPRGVSLCGLRAILGYRRAHRGPRCPDRELRYHRADAYGDVRSRLQIRQYFSGRRRASQPTPRCLRPCRGPVSMSVRASASAPTRPRLRLRRRP